MKEATLNKYLAPRIWAGWVVLVRFLADGQPKQWKAAARAVLDGSDLAKKTADNILRLGISSGFLARTGHVIRTATGWDDTRTVSLTDLGRARWAGVLEDDEEVPA